MTFKHLLWASVVLIVVGSATWIAKRDCSIFSNDSYQYLSEAKNIVAGNGWKTSIVHFDEQKFTGLMPAPQSVFPPGYPLSIAGLNLAGVPIETASWLVSLISTVALLPLLAWAARLLRVPPVPFLIALIVLAANSTTWIYGRSVLAEAFFTAIALLCLCLLFKVESLPAGRTRSIWLICAALLSGLTFSVRYAGCFFVLTVLIFYFVRLVRRHDRSASADMVMASVSLVPVGTLCLRNLWISGTLRGSSTKPVNNPVGPLIKTFIDSVFHLTFGDFTVKRDFLPPGPLEIGLVVFMLVLGVFLAKHLLKHMGEVREASRQVFIGLLTLFCVVYILGMFYLGKTTVISFGSRIFYPICPFLLLLAAGLFSKDAKVSMPRLSRRTVVLLTLAGVLYFGLHARSTWRSPSRKPHLDALALLAEPGKDGKPLSSWLRERVAPDDIIMAIDGQALGYGLDRKTYSLVSLEYGMESWSEEVLHKAAKNYRANYLIIPLHMQETERLAEQSKFMKDLVAGSVPSWLEAENQNKDVAVFQIHLHRRMRSGPP